MNIDYFASDLIRQFFKNLYREKLRYAVLRNYELLPEANDSKDVDIVVAPVDLRKVVTVLKETAKINGYQLIWENELDYLEGFVFVKIEDSDVFSIKIDIFNGFLWRGCFYLDHNFILNSAVEYKGFMVPIKAHEAFIMIVYYILYAKKIKSKYLGPIYKNVIENIDDFRTINELTFQQKISNEIINLIQKNEISSLVHLRKKIRNSIIANNLKGFGYSIRFINHIKTEYFDRNFFGTLLVFASSNGTYKGEIIDTARKIFYSLGITKIEKPHQLPTSEAIKLSQFKEIRDTDLKVNIKKELRDNQIVFFDIQYSDQIVGIKQIDRVITKIFKPLSKPDYTFLVLDDKELMKEDNKLTVNSTLKDLKVLTPNGYIAEDKLMICKNIFNMLEGKYK